jgi:hypothetical protein
MLTPSWKTYPQDSSSIQKKFYLSLFPR